MLRLKLLTIWALYERITGLKKMRKGLIQVLRFKVTLVLYPKVTLKLNVPAHALSRVE